MIKRLSVARAVSVPNGSDVPQVVRLLAVSDEREPSLEIDANRRALGPIDGIIGAGDLDPAYLDFLAEAFRAPLLHVLGNHDRGGGWETAHERLPEPIDGAWHDVRGLTVAGLSWPAAQNGRAVHDDGAAWRQVAACYLRVRRHRPDIIVSHVPPLGLGDVADDHYHRGFAAYRWLLNRLRPAVWIHGHTTPASIGSWLIESNSTKIANVTGAVLVEVGAG